MVDLQRRIENHFGVVGLVFSNWCARDVSSSFIDMLAVIKNGERLYVTEHDQQKCRGVHWIFSRKPFPKNRYAYSVFYKRQFTTSYQ